eukprot:TRINITY_DN177_c0_g1_i1.p1 TRINITY_DN177_c0_g1~~TRINITY_DN177_c0_g1_i1.p1  ORF type:complete len:431 (-),score=80.81 TRINITY_DN177_c0_g1_i1:78-1370(-)
MSNSDLEVELVPKGDTTSSFTVRPKTGTLSFDKGFFVAVKAIQLLRKKNEGEVLVIGIAGPSGSGKTSLAHKIISVLPKSVLISMDNYLDSSRKIIDENYDDYRLVDFELLAKNLSDLKKNQTTETPLYDFRKSGRYAYKTFAPPDSKVVVVEGIYALHEEIRHFLDLKISISGGVHFDLIKRIFRDIQRTGQQPHEAIQQITETVYPMYKAFIEPDLAHAQIHIVNKFNPFSGLLNPIYILKSSAKHNIPKEDVVNVLSKQTSEPPVVAKYYDIYLHPSGANPKNCTDWIRMRNTDGSYSIMFSEEIKEGGFIISPRVNFVVSVKILGGLMALGYQIGAIIHRTSTIYKDDKLVVSWDHLEELGETFVQIKGFDRALVQTAAEKLGFKSYLQKGYIELYQEKYGNKHPSNPSTQNEDTAALSSFVGAKL